MDSKGAIVTFLVALFVLEMVSGKGRTKSNKGMFKALINLYHVFTIKGKATH